MTGIREFITARLDEDEAAASSTIELERYPREAGSTIRYQWVQLTKHSSGGQGATYFPGAPSPHRVLAEVAAKRALLEYWSRAFKNPIDADKFPGPDWDLVRGAARWTLRHLAEPYADHPDYLEEWRPWPRT